MLKLRKLAAWIKDINVSEEEAAVVFVVNNSQIEYLLNKQSFTYAIEIPRIT